VKIQGAKTYAITRYTIRIMKKDEMITMEGVPIIA
jgi:hypothetical protein